MENKRRIEIVEDGGIKEGVDVRNKGDIYWANKEIGTAYIEAGLAKDAETGEIGERIEGVSKIKINKLNISQSVV
tara:strand:+ start:249 stop:473 length:225 start_codon:yes stop_codon:yes gene_type:complete